jgi:hypothetical protein
VENMESKNIIPFFENYFSELESRGWIPTLIHSWSELPERIASDLDYIISGVERGDLVNFIDAFCVRNGWILSQVMEHEPDALYCVCYRNEPPWHALKLDVAWDYRRKGRLLLNGAFLLEGRRRPSGKSFWVPAPAAEFAYVLAKGLAKSKGADPVIRRLAELWEEDPAGCLEVLRCKFGMTKGEHSACSFPESLVAAALVPGNRRFSRWRARRWGFLQMAWLMRRLRSPYGLTIAVHPNVDAAKVAEALLSAFRGSQVVSADPGFWRRRLFEYRSGLIVGGETLLGRPWVIDMTSKVTIDACVAAVLRHLHRRCEIQEHLNP